MAPVPPFKTTDDTPPPRVTRTVRKPGAAPPIPPKVTTEDVRSEYDDSSKEYKAGKFKVPAEQFHSLVGMGLATIGAPRTGMSLIKNAEAIGIEWDKLSRTNPAVRKMLERLTTGGGWGGVLMAYGAVGMVAVEESGILRKIPFLKRLFPQPPEPEDVPRDDFGNPVNLGRTA